MGKLMLAFVMACLALPTAAGELTPGTRIRLTLTRSAVSGENVWIVGRLVRADPRSLTVAPEGKRGIVQVPREAVLQLDRSIRRSFGPSILRGAVVGAVVGWALGTPASSSCPTSDLFCGVGLVAPLLTTPVGAVIGMVRAPDKWLRVEPRAALVARPVDGGFALGVSLAF